MQGITCVILCGGKGTRLGELTKDIPKPMLPIKGLPVLWYQIDYLKEQGITDIIFACGYHAEVIMDYFGDGKQFGVNIKYSVDDLLGTAGALKNTDITMTTLIINGDTLLDININDLIEAHKTQGKLITIAISETTDTERYGVFSFSEGFKEKQDSTKGFVSTGCYIVEPKILDLIPKNQVCSLEYDIFPFVDLGFHITENKWFDMGTPDFYDQVR